MPYRASFRITEDAEASTPQREVTVELSDDEVALLEAFLRYAEDLAICRMVRDGLGASIHLTYNQGAGLSFQTELPPWDDVIVLLHRLRPLILENEHASFHRARSVLGRQLTDSSFRHTLKFISDRYSGALMQSLIVMSSNDEVMNSEKMLFKWLNAYEYHRDQDKQAFLDTLHHILPLEWSRGVFVLLLIEKVRAIGDLQALSALVLGKRETLDVKI